MYAHLFSLKLTIKDPILKVFSLTRLFSLLEMTELGRVQVAELIS